MRNWLLRIFNGLPGVRRSRYTPGMREVLKLSKAEAGRLGHDHVGPEHLLLAIIRKGNGLAIEVLSRIGTDLERLRSDVEEFMVSSPPPRRNLYALDSAALEILSNSKTIAHGMGNNWIGTEHLLIALSDSETMLVSRFLRNAGVETTKLLQATKDMTDQS